MRPTLGTSITSGGVLALTNSRDNAASVGNVLTLNTTGTSNAAVPLAIVNAGTGLSMRVNDDGTTTDSTPFVIDASGTIKKLYQLSAKDFSQPEGIAFNSAGDLFIANEGTNQPGNILQVKIDQQ
jgi:hypothetical protein